MLIVNCYIVMKKMKSIALAIAILPFVGFIVSPPPNYAQKTPSQIVLESGEQRGEKPSLSDSDRAQELIKELRQCLKKALSNGEESSLEEMQGASMECTMEVIMLNPDGTINPNASELMELLLTTSGASMPTTSSKGQASVKLQPVPNSRLFSLPVTVGDRPRSFLFDTGASNSILDSQIAEELGLTGTPISNRLLSYFVVGDDCSEVNASLYYLPPLSVDTATVEGINGMGINKESIPGNFSGVLGLDFLNAFDVILDPQSLQLQLLPPSPSVAGAIPLIGRFGVTIAEAKINGKGPFLFLLDTGADIMVLSDRLSTQLSLDTSSADIDEVRGFCGVESAKKTTLDLVALQQHEARNLEAVIINSEVLQLLGVDGIVGQNFLTRYRQHWRFGEANALGFPEEGSLLLTPLEN